MLRGRDIGAEVLAKQAFQNGTAVAAGAGDATEITGPTIDRLALGSLYESVELSIHGNATLSSGGTISVTANLQDSANDSDWADYGDVFAAAVVATGASGGSAALLFEQSIDFDIRGARQYVRAQVTPDLSRAGTDTSVMAGTLVFGGASEYPAA